MPWTDAQIAGIVKEKYAIRVGKSGTDLDGDAYSLFDVGSADIMEMITFVQSWPKLDDHLFNTALFFLKLPSASTEHLILLKGFIGGSTQYDCNNDGAIKAKAKGDKKTLPKCDGNAKKAKAVAVATAPLAGATPESVVTWVRSKVPAR